MADYISRMNDTEFLDNIITSSEARDYADNANSRELHPKTKNELQEINGKILLASRLGETTVKIDGELRPQTILILQQKGYNIDFDRIPTMSGTGYKLMATNISF